MQNDFGGNRGVRLAGRGALLWCRHMSRRLADLLFTPVREVTPMSRTNSIIAAVLTAAALVSAPDIQAQHAWQTQINRQLLTSQSVRNWGDYDFRITHNVFYSVIGSWDSEYVTVNLQQGVEYRIMGKCDNDCTDVDMWLYDGYGQLIDSDVGSDDWPIVKVVATRSGTFRLKVRMASCVTSTCGVGVLVMGR